MARKIIIVCSLLVLHALKGICGINDVDSTFKVLPNGVQFIAPITKLYEWRNLQKRYDYLYDDREQINKLNQILFSRNDSLRSLVEQERYTNVKLTNELKDTKNALKVQKVKSRNRGGMTIISFFAFIVSTYFHFR